MIFFAWTLQCLNKEIDELFTELNAVNISKFIVRTKELRGVLNEIDGFPRDIALLFLSSKVILQIIIMAFTEQLEELINLD